MNTQFDLGTMLSTPTPLQNAVNQIPCDMLKPYHNHRFKLYSGERLEDMIESIKENGVLSPIIVQPITDGYEILIGHNRWNASKLAGMTTVPAIIKEGLSEEEAEMYVIESNLMQRGFDNLKISVQAAVIAQRHSEMFSQGKRNDIIRELQMLNKEENITLCHRGTKLDNNQQIAEKYGMSRRSVARLLRIDKLTKGMKELVDDGTIALLSAVEISYLSVSTQEDIVELTDDYSIDVIKAKLLRETADKNGNISNSDLIKILDGKKNTADKGKSVKISNDTFSKYFETGTKNKVITETIEKALEYYFANKGE